jgi:hypothetical protein
MEHKARRQTSPAPRGGRRPASDLAQAASAPRKRLSRWVAAPSTDRSDVPVGWLRTLNGSAGARGVGAILRGQAARGRTSVGRVPCLGSSGPASSGGLRAPAWTVYAARARRWVRIRSMTDAGVMHATIRIEPWLVGHALAWHILQCASFHSRSEPKFADLRTG